MSTLNKSESKNSSRSGSNRSISPQKSPSSGASNQTFHIPIPTIHHKASSSGNVFITPHHNNNSFSSQNTIGRNQQWLDELVQQRRVKFIPYEEFEDERILEEGDTEHRTGGTNDRIKTVSWKKMRRRVVLKDLENVNDLSDETREAFVNELKLHLQVDVNEKIIRISGLSQEAENNAYVVVMQYADGGNLQEYLAKNFKRMTWVDKCTLAKQIAEGVEFLHRNGIVHGNLHSRNILFHQSHPKLTDFGTCNHMISSSLAYAHTEPRYIPYIDPQYLYHPNIYIKDTRSDAYSLGIILWEISSGRVPFGSYSSWNADEKMVDGKFDIRGTTTHERAEELTNRIIKGVREQAVRDTPNAYFGIYNKCWQSNPAVRPTSEEVVRELERLLDEGVTTSISRGVTEDERSTVTPKRSRMSEIDLAELRKDAFAAEMWLHYQEVAEKTGKIFSLSDFLSNGDNDESDSTTEENEQNGVDQTQDNPPELTRNFQKNLSNDTYQNPVSKKWKNKARSLVKRFSGRNSRSQRVSDEIESVRNSEDDDGSGEENLSVGWTIISRDEFENYETNSSNKNASLGNLMSHNSSLNAVTETDVAGPSLIESHIDGTSNQYVYSDHCKFLFLRNQWTLNSQRCFAAYHARVGDLEGIRWHVKNDGDEVLDNVQEILGPRNSYRKPLEPLVIEATTYCPARLLLPTYTLLVNLGANIHSIDSYTSGTCINFLATNTSLLSDPPSSTHSMFTTSSSPNGYYFRQCLTFLLSRGLDINSQTITGDTLLTSLIFRWHPNLTPEIIEFLIKNGANPNLANKRGGTPLGYTLLATRFENDGGPFKKVYRILNMLIEGGGDINQETVIPGRRMKNLLWVLVDVSVNLKIEEQRKTLELLLERGIDVGKLKGREEESGIFGNEVFGGSMEMTGEHDEYEELIYNSPTDVSSQDEFLGVGTSATSATQQKASTLKFPSSQIKARTPSTSLATHNIPLSLLRPHRRTSSQSTQTSPTSPTSNYLINPSQIDLAASQRESRPVPMFIPPKPLNAMVYAVQLNRYEMVKILLERVYEFSETESVLDALKECGISNYESFGHKKSSSGGNIITGLFGNAGFRRQAKRYGGHSEIIKYLMTWAGDNDDKRKKVLSKSEKAKSRWKNN
ncbi:17841_t:CDS:10, partial [Acaulospora morrowiae]